MKLSILSRRLACIGISAIGFALFPATSANATLIDSFDTAFNAPQTSLFATPGSPDSAVVNDSTGIAGGQREMTLTVTQGMGAASIGTDGGTAILQVQGGTAVQSNLQLTYDGNADVPALSTFAPTGLGGLALSGTSFLLQAMSDNPITASFRVFTDATHFSDGVLTTTATGMGTYQTFGIPFTNFTAGTGSAGAADFSNVGAIQVNLTVTGAAALGYDSIQTGGSLAVVPEPGSWALVCLGALGMIGVSQFRRRKVPASLGNCQFFLPFENGSCGSNRTAHFSFPQPLRRWEADESRPWSNGRRFRWEEELGLDLFRAEAFAGPA